MMYMAKQILLILLTLIFGLLTSDGFVQQLGAIEGVVTDGEGTTFPGLKVVVKNGAFRREATTDADGKYKLELPSGTYEVSAGTDCNQSMFYQKEVKVSDGITPLNIKLNI